MKRWHIISGISLIMVCVLIALGTLFYKYYLVPNYLEPVVNQISEYLQDEEVVEELYDHAMRLHDEGVMDDETYDNFITAYRTRMKNSDESKEDEARALLEAATSPEGQVAEETSSLSAKYASSKVGVELVQTNEGYSSGSSSKRYSSERTSTRIKAEDIVEAEKIVANEEKETVKEEEKEEDLVKSAYAKLKENMTSGEYSDFVTIMGKMDINTLKTYISDKEGLKQYMKSKLTEDEYKRIVNLGYKYMNLFIEE